MKQLDKLQLVNQALIPTEWKTITIRLPKESTDLFKRVLKAYKLWNETEHDSTAFTHIIAEAMTSIPDSVWEISDK